jgi:hypothetical protein
MRNISANVQYIPGRQLAVRPLSGNLALDFFVAGDDGGETESASSIRFENTADLDHYVPHIAVHIKDLKAIGNAANCDAAPRDCVHVGGQWLPFPG